MCQMGAGGEGLGNNTEETQGVLEKGSRSARVLGLLEGHRSGIASTDHD